MNEKPLYTIKIIFIDKSIYSAETEYNIDMFYKSIYKEKNDFIILDKEFIINKKNICYISIKKKT
jgi:uncharacterized protein YjbK